MTPASASSPPAQSARISIGSVPESAGSPEAAGTTVSMTNFSGQGSASRAAVASNSAITEPASIDR